MSSLIGFNSVLTTLKFSFNGVHLWLVKLARPVDIRYLSLLIKLSLKYFMLEDHIAPEDVDHVALIVY